MSVYRYQMMIMHLPAAKKGRGFYYGLRITERASGKPVMTVPALSSNKAAVMLLKRRLEENGVSPCHVRDLWEDMMPV